MRPATLRSERPAGRCCISTRRAPRPASFTPYAPSASDFSAQSHTRVWLCAEKSGEGRGSPVLLPALGLEQGRAQRCEGFGAGVPEATVVGLEQALGDGAQGPRGGALEELAHVGI